MRLAALLALSALAVSLPATADCGDYADNLLATENCDADEDANGLTAGVGVVSHEALDGLPAGSFRVESGDDKGPTVIVYFCAPDTTEQLFSIAVSLRNSTGGSIQCFFQARTMSEPACSGTIDPSSSLIQIVDSSDWQTFTFERDTGSDGQSADIRVECDGDAPFAILLDNLYLVEGLEGAPLFYDGFEDGDLEHW